MTPKYEIHDLNSIDLIAIEKQARALRAQALSAWTASAFAAIRGAFANIRLGGRNKHA